MANQYGIDMGKVTRVKDEVELNKLRKTKMEHENKADAAGVKNRLRDIRASNPNMSEEDLTNAAMDEEGYNTDKKHKNALSLQSNSHSLQRSTAKYKHDLAFTSTKEEVARRTKILQAQHPDMAPELVEAWAQDQSKDFSKVMKTISEAETVQQIDAVTKVISDSGAALHTIGTIKDPAAQQIAWSEFRNKKIASIKDPKLMQEAMQKLPEKYDANWAGMQIASSAKIMKDAQLAKTYLKRTEAEIKAEGDAGPTYPQKTAVTNAVSSRVNTIYKDMVDPEAGSKVKDRAMKLIAEDGWKHKNIDKLINQAQAEIEQEEIDAVPKKDKNAFMKWWDGDEEKTQKETKAKPKKNIIEGTAPAKFRGKTMMYKGQKVKIDQDGKITAI